MKKIIALLLLSLSLIGCINKYRDISQEDLSNNILSVIYESNYSKGDSKSLLLIKDSYANSFVQFLTPHFKKIIMVNPRYFYGDIEDIIKNHEITDLLYLYNANTFFNDTSLNSVLEI